MSASRAEGLSFRGVALIEHDDDEVLRYASGTTGTDDDAAITTASRFQLASVSKQFTAAAVLRCVDEGRCSLSDRVVDLLAGCPATWDRITVHQLLCHSAGLVHWQQLPDLDLCARHERDAVLAAFAAAPLLFEPGARFSYSSPGYVLLAWVVEQVTARPYAEVLEDELFSPLGLRDTFVGNGEGRPRLTAPLRAGERVASFELDVVGMGAGDAWSTVDDLAAWDRAVLEGRVLSDESRRAMLAPQVAIDERLGEVHLGGYGYGWYLGSVAGRRARFHTGDNAGFQSVNLVLPDDGARVVALTNDETTDLYSVGLRLVELAT